MRENREQIRLMLDRNALTQVWLINQLEGQGVDTDKTEMSSILRGTRKGPKAELIMDKSLEILEVYESKMRA